MKYLVAAGRSCTDVEKWRLQTGERNWSWRKKGEGKEEEEENILNAQSIGMSRWVWSIGCVE
jgi:hypothetical protein